MASSSSNDPMAVMRYRKGPVAGGARECPWKGEPRRYQTVAKSATHCHAAQPDSPRRGRVLPRNTRDAGAGTLGRGRWSTDDRVRLLPAAGHRRIRHANQRHNEPMCAVSPSFREWLDGICLAVRAAECSFRRVQTVSSLTRLPGLLCLQVRRNRKYPSLWMGVIS